MTTPGTDRLVRMGPYDLLELLGRGGMGAVYRGRHATTNQVVAVKVMARETAANPVHLKRFQQEFEIARRLRHPNIVQGLDFGLDGERPFLVLEFIDGQNLGKIVRDRGPLDEAEAVRLVLQIADALHLAHEQKIIHRDIKPDNILLTNDGTAKLTDLGLIKDLSADGQLTQTQTFLGTAAFMAPEQFDDARNADVRCDVYGLAATLYYLLTGAMPFQGRGNLTILAKKMKNDFLPPRRHMPTLREGVDQAICRSLDADPARRPESVTELAGLLRGALDSPPGKAVNGQADAPAAASVPAAPPASDERRVAPRYPCALEASCSPIQSGLRQWRGEVLDISLSGIHLQLDRRFEPGSVLRVEVLDQQLAVLTTWLVQTRWVREVTTRRWSLGCAFNTHLTDDELNNFLNTLPPTVIVRERR